MNWKKYLTPLLWALGGVAALIPAVVRPMLNGEQINYPFVATASVFFVFAVAFFVTIKN